MRTHEQYQKFSVRLSSHIQEVTRGIALSLSGNSTFILPPGRVRPVVWSVCFVSFHICLDSKFENGFGGDAEFQRLQ